MNKKIWVAGILPMALSACHETGHGQKNVLFIMVDDMKPALGCYGDSLAITPNIDSFSSEAVIYTKAYCQQALSGPSRASLLTGLRPQETGVTELNTWMRAKDPEIVTLPQAFKEAGYETVSVGKTFHGNRNTTDTLSWTRTPVRFKYGKNDEYLLSENKTGGKSVAYEFTDAPDSAYLDGRIRNEALSVLRDLAHGDKPFFLAVGFLKPHLPFCAPEKYRSLYDGVFAEDIDTVSIKGAPAIAYHNSDELRGYADIPDVGPLTMEQHAQLKAAYYACVSFTDENIGILLEELKRLGLWENTVVVILGDHGYHMGEQGLWCKSTNYEAACRAPLMIRNPRKPVGWKDDSPVQFIDIFPTLARLCGVDAPEKLPGQDLFGGKHNSFAFSQFPRPYRALHNASARTHMGYTVRDEDWRYVEWYDNEGILTASELYDLRTSELETENLSGLSEYSAEQHRLSQVLRTEFGL